HTDGKFSPEDRSGWYPRPSQVIARYRERVGWSRAQLAVRMGVVEDVVHKAEREGRGLDSLARRRQVCTLLQIPPALLGLCPIPLDAGWWVHEYEPWPAGPDGWPDTGAVIKWYRRAKEWTQVQLAESLKVQELTVRNMENRKRGLDSISRRRAVGFLLGVPSLLLGLDAVHGPSQVAPKVSPYLGSSIQLPSLERVQTIQARLWSGYYTGHAQEKVPQVRGMLARIDDVLLQAPEAETPAWLEVQSLGYQWLGNVLRDNADPRMVLAYNRKAVELARHTGNLDLLSIALMRQMESAYALGDNEQAVKFAQVFARTQESDPVLSSGRAITSARVLALAASDQADRSQVLRLVEQCQTFGNSYGINNTPEASTRRHAEALLNLSFSARDRSRLLSQASDLLERLDSSQFDIRRQIEVLLALARVALARKEYDQAAAYALEAWPLVSELQNWRKLPQITEIYRALSQSSYAGSPQVARLSLLLFEVGAL
ncbi:MAG: transcriptional regulator, partial [Ktedonobacteraceae bacterium]